LHEFAPNAIPPYAILSHTWGEADEEVKLQDVGTPGVAQKAGYAKIKGCCRQAQVDGLAYAWVDTCCIDKSSSAELSEAINSMFRWYANAKFCYAYLVDVPTSSDSNDLVSFSSSRWFTRGWTLQELIAPENVVFYTKEWKKLGTKSELSVTISAVTGVQNEILLGNKSLMRVSIADRMSWASQRVTTRPEDIAYCLLGIFDINMPLLYGEDEKAFIRLQEEIIKVSDDHSIFAWKFIHFHLFDNSSKSSLLASSPNAFRNIGSIVPYEASGKTPFAMSNIGLQIELPILRYGDIFSGYLAVLNCRSAGEESPLAIHLRPVPGDEVRYVRLNSKDPVTLPLWKVAKAVRRTIYIEIRKPQTPLRLLLPPQRIVFRTLPAEETFRLIDFYPRDSWRENDRAFVFHTRTFIRRFGLLFKDQSGDCIAVIGGAANGWVGLLPNPYDFTTMNHGHEDTLTKRATMIWKDGEGYLEIVVELQVILVGYDMMTVVDMKTFTSSGEQLHPLQ
jgi:hypothetical protein